MTVAISSIPTACPKSRASKPNDCDKDVLAQDMPPQSIGHVHRPGRCRDIKALEDRPVKRGMSNLLVAHARNNHLRDLCFELVDQIDQIEESSSSPGADDRRGDSDAQMNFSGAGAADEDRIAFGVEEGAGGEFAYLPFIE